MANLMWFNEFGNLDILNRGQNLEVGRGCDSSWPEYSNDKELDPQQGQSKEQQR